MQRILVGTDFSAAGTRAIQVAVSWARRHGAALRIVHVAPSKRQLIGPWRSDRGTVSGIHHSAGAALKRVVEAADPSRELEVSTGLISGAASVQIARTARDFRADLLVIGARGEHETAVQPPALGGTSLKLLGKMTIPLLLVRDERAGAPKSVLATLDLSPLSEHVLAWSRACTAAGGCITVFHAYEAPFASRLDSYGIARDSIDLYSEHEQERRRRELDALAAPAAAGVSVRTVLERGDPIELLFRQIRTLDPELIVLGKHAGRARRKADPGGSVSRYTALFAPTNVLIVPPP